MLRSILTYLLILSVALQPFSREMTIMSFEMNREYIIKNLCENRNRPQLHCDGKCYLAKKLKAQRERDDQQTSEQIRNLTFMQWYCADLSTVILTAAVAFLPVHAPAGHYIEPVSTAFAPGVFQPPRA